MTRRLAAIAAAAIVAAVLFPLLVSGPDLDRVALALALAGPAAGAAVAASAGRPLLAAAALAGVGGYTSGLLSVRGVAVPLAVVCGAAAGAAAAVAIGVVAARLDSAAFLLITLLVALAGGSAVLAAPGLTHGQSGLGPLPSLSSAFGGRTRDVLTPEGDFHVLLLVAATGTALAVVLLGRGPGPRWRAIGSDRARAASSGLRPLGGEVAALALAGGLAALSGALSAQVAQVATPDAFAPDLAAVPLLAALAARRHPTGAVLLAVATGVLGDVVLPDHGWQGPPGAMALAVGVLALAALVSLLPWRRPVAAPAEPFVDPGAPWPVAALGLGGTALTVPATTLTTPEGLVLVEAPAFSVPAGAVHAVVGPNGAGKSTLLASIAGGAATTAGRVTLLAQDGGGFASCTVAETLVLAARRGRDAAAARHLAGLWQDHLGLKAMGGRRCAELSSGQLRLLDMARVLLGSPDVLLCDEPLAGLDPSYRAAATACLAAAAACGLTIVVAEHDGEAVAALAGSLTELRRHDGPGAVTAGTSDTGPSVERR